MVDLELLWPTLIVYFTVMFAIAAWSARTKVSSMEDMAVAGRNVGPWLIAFSVVATWINGVTLIANTGMGQVLGISGYWCTGGFLVGTIWSGYYLITKLRTLRIITIPELFDRVYGPGHGSMSLLLVLLRDLGATAGTLGAMAAVTQFILQVSIGEALLITFGVTVAYVALGGMWAVLITDAVQCVIILVSSIALFAFALIEVGGFSAAAARSSDEGLFTMVGKAGLGQQIGWFVMGFAITCSYQTMVQRGLSARTTEIARRGFVYGGLISIAWYMVPYVTGLLAVLLYGDTVRPDEVFLKMTTELLNPYLGTIVVVSILAANMSTLSSTINTIASNFTVDVYRRFINPAASKRRLFVVSRVNVILAGLLAMCIYYFVQEMMELFWLGGRIMASAFTPVLVGLLFFPAVRRARGAVMTTFILGSLVSILSQITMPYTKPEGASFRIWAVDPILVSLPIAVVILVVGTWIEVKPVLHRTPKSRGEKT